MTWNYDNKPHSQADTALEHAVNKWFGGASSYEVEDIADTEIEDQARYYYTVTLADGSKKTAMVMLATMEVFSSLDDGTPLRYKQ